MWYTELPYITHDSTPGYVALKELIINIQTKSCVHNIRNSLKIETIHMFINRLANCDLLT